MLLALLSLETTLHPFIVLSLELRKREMLLLSYFLAGLHKQSVVKLIAEIKSAHCLMY